MKNMKPAKAVGKMKTANKISFLLLAFVVASGGMTGCVKVYENEKIEVIRRPQIDATPEIPGWDDGGVEVID